MYVAGGGGRGDSVLELQILKLSAQKCHLKSWYWMKSLTEAVYTEKLKQANKRDRECIQKHSNINSQERGEKTSQEDQKGGLTMSEETKDSGVLRGDQQQVMCLKNAFISSRLLTENRLLDLATLIVPDNV